MYKSVGLTHVQSTLCRLQKTYKLRSLRESMVHVKVYLPKAATNYDYAHHRVCLLFRDRFGGLTEFGGSGQWVNENDTVVSEPVTVIESYTDMPVEEARDLMQDMAGWIESWTGEDSVMVTVNHTAYFS